MQKLLQTTALLGVLVGLTLSPAVALAGEIIVEEPVFVPDISDFLDVQDGADAVADDESQGSEEDGGEAEAEDYDAEDAESLTEGVVTDFNDSISFCAAIASDEYVIDCLSERLDVIAGKLPETGEFAEMRTIIADASSQLSAIAAQNQSDTLPTGVARSQGATPVATTRPLRPVATEALAASLQAADAVIAQAELTLLRSSSNSQDRALNYQQVAAVIGSSRSLLRSA